MKLSPVPAALGPSESWGQQLPSRGRWSRRTFLGVLSSLAVGAVSGCSVPGDVGQQVEDPGEGGLLGSGGSRRQGAPDPQYEPLEPYKLQAECELTEDFFSVAVQRIDPAKDTVVAYSRADGDVEAIVLQGGVVHQYYRDPTQPGGWATHALSNPTTPDVTAVVAGMSSVDPRGSQGSDRWLKVFWTRKPANSSVQSPTLYIATEQGPPAAGSVPSFAFSQINWGSTAFGLRLAVNVDDSLLVAAMQNSSVSKGKTNSDAKLYFWTDGRSVDHDTGQNMPASGGYLSGFQYTTPLENPLIILGLVKAPWAAVVAQPDQGVKGQFGLNTPTLMLYLPFGSYDRNDHYAPMVRIWAWTVRSGPDQKVSKVYSWNDTVDHPPAIPVAGNILHAATVYYVSSLGGTNAPTMLVQTIGVENKDTPDEDILLRLWIGSHDSHATTQGDYASWTWTELGAGGTQSQDDWIQAFSPALRPLETGEADDPGHPAPRSFLDVFVVVHGRLSVFRQAPTGSVYLDYSKPAYTPAIPLETDVGAMAGQAGQSAGDELLYVDVDGRLRTLTKGSPSEPWADASVTLPANELEQLDSYRVLLTVTDDRGYPINGASLSVSASTPATMSVSQEDGSSRSTILGKAGTVVTTGSGGAALLALVAEGVSAPTLTVTGPGGSTLTVYPSAAVNTYFQGGGRLNYLDPIDADGTLAAARTSANGLVFPGAGDKSAVQDATAMIALASQQATAKGLSSARRSATLGRRDGSLPTSHSRDHAALQGIVKDIDHWSHDALQAFKKGAARVKKITYDATGRVFQLIGEFEGWADQAISFVVEGVEDAAHVVQAAFNKLGALIREAVHWLAAEVIGTLVDSFQLATQYQKWIGGEDGLLTYLAGQINNGRSAVDPWLDNQEQRIKNDFEAWRKAVHPESTMGSMARTAAPPKSVGSPRRVGNSSGDGHNSATHHGAWLFNFSRWKLDLKSEIDTGPIDWSAVHALIAAVAGAVTDATKALTDSVKEFIAFWRRVVTHPNDILGLAEDALLTAVEGIVEFAFYLVRKIADVLLSVAESVLGHLSDLLFTTPLAPLPGLQQLLDRAGLKEPKLGHFLLAVVAFPAVVAHKIKNRGQGYPFQPDQLADRREGSGETAESDILTAAAGLSFIWAMVDTESAIFTATKEEGPRFIEILDILIPVTLSVLLTPSTEGKRPFALPPDDDAHIFGYLAWVLGMVDPILAAVELKANHQLKNDKLALAAATDTLLYMETTLGAFDLIFSCIQAHYDDDDGFEYADAVFDCLPLLASPLLLDEVLASSSLVSAGVDAAVTAGSGIVSGILFARESDF